MKKNRLLIMLLLTGSIAHAQNSVTLYGVIDEGLTFNSNQGGGHVLAAASNGLQASRWGLRGTEDLGGGLKAIFALEGGFEVNTGALSQGNRLFGRQAFVGLSSRYGTITFGRQYDTVFDYIQPISGATTVGTYGGHPLDNDNMEDNFRVNNAVKVRTESYSGFSAEAMYGFSNTADGFSQNSMWGVASGYKSGPLSLGIQVEKFDHPASNSNGAVGSSGGNTTSDYAALANTFVSGEINNQYIASAAGIYTFGKALFGGMYSHVLYEMPTTNIWFDNFEVDAGYWINPFLRLDGTYTFTNGRVDVVDQNPKYHQVTVLLDYFLSKATDVYTVVAYQRAAGSAQFARIYPMGASSNRNQLLARISIRHKF